MRSRLASPATVHFQAHSDDGFLCQDKAGQMFGFCCTSTFLYTTGYLYFLLSPSQFNLLVGLLECPVLEGVACAALGSLSNQPSDHLRFPECIRIDMSLLSNLKSAFLSATVLLSSCEEKTTPLF